MNNDRLPVGLTTTIKPEDVKQNSGDLISREALKKAIEPYRYAICGFEGILALIDNAPSVTPRDNEDKEVADNEQEAYEFLVCLQEEMRQKGREEQYNALQVAIDRLKRQ